MKTIVTLIKLRIALLSAAAAAAGALLAGGHHVMCPILGTFLLAGGAAALNQIQERDLDARITRTRHRPLPAGAITLRAAWFIVIALLLAGFTVLSLTGNALTVTLGALAVLSYNALYTPLKRRTTAAPVIGAVVGAFAPAIGWTGAGGDNCPPPLIALIAFFVVWQLPHFWLLWLRASDDYAAAGLPAPTVGLNEAALRRVTFAWALAAAAIGLMLPLLGVIQYAPALVALWLAALWLGVQACRSVPQAFTAINAFAVVLLAAIIFEKWN